tara:strand:+ start:48 stop:302 length:255 start_codon:yes stop_codon:yes gene_type:complete
MKRSQWITFGIVFTIGFLFLIMFAMTWNQICNTTLSSTTTGDSSETTALYTACVIKAQSYFILAFILFLLSVAFGISAILENKK